ncbi:MAG: hypothetical protein HXS41_04755, partial [Theionarchaea archaeon]|nr:hypothetical protein [Theionarchaea archaeon]
MEIPVLYKRETDTKKGGRNMGDPITPEDSEKKKNTEREGKKSEKEEKKKGRTYP